MKTSDEFKNEVYLRAKAEKTRIKRRNKILLTAVPCIAIAIIIGVYGLTINRMSMKESQVEDVIESTVQQITTEKETQAPDENEEDLTQSVKEEVGLTEAATKTPSDKSPFDNSFEVSLCMSEIFSLNDKNNFDEQTAVINSKNELSAFIKSNSNLGFNEEFFEGIKNYDDSFFKDNSLFVVVSSFKNNENEVNPEVFLYSNEKSIDINIKASKSNKKEDLKIVFVPIDKESVKPNVQINVSFS